MIETFIEDGVKYRRITTDSGSEIVERIGDPELPDDYVPPAFDFSQIPSEQARIESLESENTDLKTRLVDIEVAIAELLAGGA
jgi:hypothetical protein